MTAHHLADRTDGQTGSAATVECTSKGVLPALAIDGADGAVLDAQAALLAQIFGQRTTSGQGAVADDGGHIDPGTEFG
jgi:hypothetical protein